MLELKNQFVFAPIKLGYSSDGNVNERHVAFYGERSRYMGAVTLEPLYMDKGLREIPTQLGIDDDDKIEGLKRLTDLFHETNTRAIAHLNHPGRMANPKIPGNYFLSSSDRPCENGGARPKRMDTEDFGRVLDMFRSAAARAEKAGFDAVELQMGHGYLLAQFISPAVNDREDEYGGDFDNRVRFPLMVFDALKEATSLPVIVRISGDEMVPGGFGLSEMMNLSKRLEERGAAAIHVTAGSVCSTPPWFFQHMFIPKGKTWEMAKEIKNGIRIPVISVGRINTFEDIEKLKEDYDADYMAVGRALVADPDFVGKYLGEVGGNPRPCLACSEGCLGGVKSGMGLGCVVNPLVGRDDFELSRTAQPKKYAVVGGGLAGMEAAVTLKKRGHEVVLYERDRLGGQFNLASLPPNKESLSKLVDYYTKELSDAGIDVIREEATEAELLGGGYDGVLLATGSEPAIPKIEGLKEYYWAEVLRDENLFEGRKVVVIGGGLIGIEVAHKLLKKGNEVIIVEMLDEIARGMEAIEKTLTLKSFEKEVVAIYLNSRVTKVEGDRVFIEGEKNIVLDGVDHIVAAVGMRSYNPLEPALEGKIDVYTIGDAKKVGKAQDAIRDAFETASKL